MLKRYITSTSSTDAEILDLATGLLKRVTYPAGSILFVGSLNNEMVRCHIELDRFLQLNDPCQQKVKEGDMDWQLV